jgi:acetylornithine deacetylase/succinyl-diaminopimelate desuccinylase-like protein
MIIAEVFYGIKCNRCGEIYDGGDFSFWNDEGTAIENATEADWAELNGKHYCTDCHELGEDRDVVKVYDDYPKHLKTLNTFITYVVAGSKNVIENEVGFTVNCRFFKKKRLEPLEEDYVKQLLADKFVSLEYEEGKYGSVICIIKFNK